MKTHSTNYTHTFIEVAEDCPAKTGEIPPDKGGDKTAASLQFEMISRHPYTYTSDDVIFYVYAVKNGLSKGNLSVEREQFFSKGQPCLRSSPLTKRYGWGIHHNEEGKVAMYPMESPEYKNMVKDTTITTVKAMRSKRV